MMDDQLYHPASMVHVVENPIEIHVHNEINGREIQRIIKKVASSDIGLQI